MLLEVLPIYCNIYNAPKPKDAAYGTFRKNTQVWKDAAVNGRRFSEAISSAKVPENCLSVKVAQHQPVQLDLQHL